MRFGGSDRVAGGHDVGICRGLLRCRGHAAPVPGPIAVMPRPWQAEDDASVRHGGKLLEAGCHRGLPSSYTGKEVVQS